jgi:hypothetical protein
METKFQRLTPIFGVQQFNETRRNTVTCNRKLQVQDGDRQTGSIHISGSTQDRDEISMANCMFFKVDHINNLYPNIRRHRPTSETRWQLTN